MLEKILKKEKAPNFTSLISWFFKFYFVVCTETNFPVHHILKIVNLKVHWFSPILNGHRLEPFPTVFCGTGNRVLGMHCSCVTGRDSHTQDTSRVRPHPIPGRLLPPASEVADSGFLVLVLFSRGFHTQFFMAAQSILSAWLCQNIVLQPVEIM